MCGRLVNLDTVARVLAEYYHLKTETQLATLDEALSRVPAETVGKELFGNSEQLNDTISRAVVVDAIEGVDWYHQNQHGEMVHGANPDEHQAWYKTEDIYKAVESVPSAQSEQRYTEEELRVFAHGISLSLLSKRSAQHWRYDKDTATEIEFLERLYDKVSADMKGRQG